MTTHKRKKSLVGWTHKKWVLKMHLAQMRIPNIFPRLVYGDKVYHDMNWKKGVKVRITIEEI